MKNIGVSQKVIIINKENKILSLRRSKTHPHKPFSWDLPGGDLDFGEDPTQGIIRETKEEAGLDIYDISPFDVEAHITPDQNFWITIAYTAKCDSKDVVLSYEHDQFKWLNREEFLLLDSSPKLQRFIKRLT
ncbi:MAG: NUDIX hydrolase [Candidatus Pacebacteria bacterium]|nr:NUDIX hydrolase [Candidatus Paceibacterota bacterium]